PDRPRTEQVENLSLDDALVTHRFIAPDHERDFLRITAVLLDVPREHLVGEPDPELPRRALRDLLRIDAVEVLAGRVRVGITDRLAAAADRHETAVERTDEVVELARGRAHDARV